MNPQNQFFSEFCATVLLTMLAGAIGALCGWAGILGYGIVFGVGVLAGAWFLEGINNRGGKR